MEWNRLIATEKQEFSLQKKEFEHFSKIRCGR